MSALRLSEMERRELFRMEMEIRDLTVDNAFDFCAVLDAVGVNNVIGAFDKEEIYALRKGGKDLKGIGLVLAAKAAGVLIGHLPAAREPLYVFLAGCVQWTNGHPVTVDELRKMKLGAFVQLIKSFAQQEDIVDFFTDAAGFVNTDATGSGSSSGADTAPPPITSDTPSGEAD